MEKERSLKPYAQVHRSIFIISVLFCVLVYAPLVIFREGAQAFVSSLMNFVTFNLDWLFQGVGFLCFVFAIWLIFGQYGNVKLGTKDDKPEFRNFTWIAMFFCAGIGAGAVYWAFLEPLYYLSAGPFRIEEYSIAAREWTMGYTYFHWGLTPWSIFAVPALAFAYSYYNRKELHFKASYACRGVLGRYAYGTGGTIIDVIVVVGMIGGFATSLGFVFPMLSGLIAQYLDIADTIWLQVGIGAFFTAVYTYSTYKGLYSGIAKLSDINMVMFIGLIGFILLAGPTMWIISYFFDSIGIMLQNFIRMSFYTDAVSGSGFPQNWTVFYWAWWAAWAIYIGLFMARISKGRTIRAFVSNMLFVAGGGTILIFSVIGGYGQHVHFNQGIDLTSILAESGGAATIYALMDTLPGSQIVIPIFVIVLIVAQATGIDSAAYTLGNITSREVGYEVEPQIWLRVFWALLIFFATISLLLVGGMQVVQLSSILTSVPILILLVIFMVAISKWLREDFGVGKIRHIELPEERQSEKVS